MQSISAAPWRSEDVRHPSTDRAFLLGLCALGALLVGAGLALHPVETVLQGWRAITLSPKALYTDSMAVGGMGAAFFNSGVMTLLSCALLWLLHARLTGYQLAAALSMTAYSFFGKTPLNALPLVAGVLLYHRLDKVPLHQAAGMALFATCLGPLVSTVAFGSGLPQAAGVPLGIALGVLAGFLVVPVVRKTGAFHQGYNLYNMGLAAGLVSMGLMNLLKLFGVQADTTSVMDEGGGMWLAAALGALFLLTALIGFFLNGRSLKGYGELLKTSGKLASDYTRPFGPGLCLLNMGILGLMGLAVPLATGAPLNGPVTGAILTMYGFGAFGKHPRGVLPLFAGTLFASWLGIHDLDAAATVVPVLFASTLSPLAAEFGPFVGFAAGILHVALVHNMRVLHMGVNLYNNGFAAGFVAWLMLTLMDAFKRMGHHEKGI